MATDDGRLGQSDEAPASGARRRPGSHARDAIADQVTVDERERVEREFTEDRDLTEDDRLELFRDSQAQSVLPDLPPMPGYHLFWATTNNPRDSISWRLRLGYRLLRLEDVPGWDSVGVTAGGIDGVVGINEMVAMCVPLTLYNKYMREVHHNLPLAEEEKLAAQTDEFREKAASRGVRVDVGDGTAALVQKGKPPVFAA